MNANIIFITGKPGSGKTTFIRKLATLLQQSGIKTEGFYAEGYWRNNQRSGFDIVEINGLCRECLCNTVSGDGDIPFRRFYFKQRGLDFGNNLLQQSAGNQSVMFVDEVGPFELQGNGWDAAFGKLVINPPAAIVCTVREGLIGNVMEKWKLAPVKVVDCGASATDVVFEFLKTLTDVEG